MSDDKLHKTTVAIYARVSTEEQREGQTIDSQVAELERFITQKGWCLIDIYKDEGWSGSLLARPQLDRLRDDASLGKFNLVLINDVDRLARDVSHLGIVKRDLERRGVEVVFRKLPTEKSPTSNLMINILGSFAEFEREMIADRTRRGRRHKVEARQQFLGSKPAYGYRYIRRDRATGREGFLEVVPEEAAVVKCMYQWVDKEGLSARQVQQRLNMKCDQPRSGKGWAKSTVLRVLRSEMYAGVWHYNKHYSCEPENPKKQGRYKPPKSSTRLRSRTEWLPVILPDHLRIIERVQWESVQRQLTKNISFSPRNSQHSYLLKGLVQCGSCWATYVGDPCHGKFYYRCVKRCKSLPTIREEVLDETVWNAIEEVVRNPQLVLDQVAHFQKRNEANKKRQANEVSEVKGTLDQIHDEESRILEAYRRGIISPIQLGSELEKLKARKNSLSERKHQLVEDRKNFANLAVRYSLIDYCEKVSGQLKSFTAEQRQRFLRLLIESIVFEGDKIRIKGVFRLSDINRTEITSTANEMDNDSVSTTIPTETNPYFVNSSRIVLTKIDSCGRNSVPGESLGFLLTKPIVIRPLCQRERNQLGQFVSSANKSSQAA